MTSTMEILDISMDEILFDEDFNCRGHIVPRDVIELSKDIEANGLIQPVSVVPLTGYRLNANPGKKYLLIAGYRRFTAFKILKRETIAAILRTDMGNESDARFFNLSENIQREQLTIKQEADAIAKLVRLGVTEAEAMKRLGKARGWVQVRFMIVKLPEVVQQEIGAGWLTQSQIRDCYSHFDKHGAAACYEIVKQFKDDKIKGRKGTRKKVKKKVNPNTKHPRSREEIFALQERVYVALKGNSIVTRVLAWAAGEITEGAVQSSLKTWAEDIGEEYRIPE